MLFRTMMTTMMIQSTPVSFGAVGTPIVIGVDAGLKTSELSTQLLQAGSSWDQFLMLINVVLKFKVYETKIIPKTT